jgi:hypothetical protein
MTFINSLKPDIESQAQEEAVTGPWDAHWFLVSSINLACAV